MHAHARARTRTHEHARVQTNVPARLEGRLSGNEYCPSVAHSCAEGNALAKGPARTYRRERRKTWRWGRADASPNGCARRHQRQ
eukprot:2517729-Pleurochrysis_carterae.AAC.1